MPKQNTVVIPIQQDSGKRKITSMEKEKVSARAKTPTESSQAPARIDAFDPEHEQASAILAYHFWQERGCPIGSPEEDWFRAEQALNAIAVGPGLRRNASQRYTKATGTLRRGRQASA
jgi:hypothetical protein